MCRSHSLYMELRMTFGSWFSPSTMWVLGLNLWLSGLAANTLPHWASPLVLRSLQASPKPCAQVMHSHEIAGSLSLAFVLDQHQSHQHSFIPQHSFILWAAPSSRWLCLCHTGWLFHSRKVVHSLPQHSFILWAALPSRWFCLCHTGWLYFTAERWFTVC